MPERSTIYEVARQSGVSTATVSRVMGNGTGFSEATRTRVLAAAAELDWFPSGTARGLASRRNGIIGLLFPDLGSSDDLEVESPLYVDQVIRGAESAATADGDAVLIAATRGASGRALALAVASKCDGLVVVARALNESDLATLAQRVPVVVLSDQVGRRTNVDAVGVDNRSGLRGLVAHLTSVHGYTDLAFVGGPADSPDSIERFAAFRQGVAAAGLHAPRAPDADGGFTEGGGARAVADLLDRRSDQGRTPPRAIVCGNDEMAVGALGVLSSQHLHVPGDVAVTGFDDLAIARHVRPSLTTVAQPIREIGAEAVRAVVARLADGAAQRRSVVLPTRVVLRSSCGCTHGHGHRETAAGDEQQTSRAGSRA
ncbi:LacI family DNA-binding transcriptional regulator [Xylanimonas sp. McL0601]|uniref:LacI family DNA-binding transcriptional regulator n=1 Tax=Xylanimonas sp. McL0601 TaxID=3414739 RepID=UPI003CED1162